MNPVAKKTPPAPIEPEKSGRDRRLALDLSPVVFDVLSRISDTLGVPKSQVVVQALIQAMPGLVERAEGLEAALRKGKK